MDYLFPIIQVALDVRLQEWRQVIDESGEEGVYPKILAHIVRVYNYLQLVCREIIEFFLQRVPETNLACKIPQCFAGQIGRGNPR